MLRDSVCGMVEKDSSIRRKIKDRIYYFCSETCVKTYEQPEQELKAMKRQVALALMSVLSVAVLRNSHFRLSCSNNDF